MKKILLSICLLNVFILPVALLHADDSNKNESQVDKLAAIYNEGETAAANTLAPPLLFSGNLNPVQLPEIKGISLLKEDYLPGYAGNLDYETLSGEGVRLKFGTLEQKNSFFLVFDKPHDLRNHWLRLNYTGLGAPPRLNLEFDHDESRNDSEYSVYLEDSAQPESVYFKLPSKESFADIASVRFNMEPEFADEANADFLILDLQVLPEDADPLANLPETDFSRFDSLSESMKADNNTPVNTQKTF